MKIDQSIADLVQEAKHGDKRAEEILWTKLHDRITVLVKHKIQGYSSPYEKSEREQDVQDLVLDIWMVIKQKFSHTEFRNFLGWVNKVIYYKLGNYFRAKQRKPARFPPFDPDDEESGIFEPPDPAAYREEYIVFVSDVKRALASLGKNCKKIFRIILQGGSREDILDQFPGVKPNVVDVRIHRCKEELRRILREGGYDQ